MREKMRLLITLESNRRLTDPLIPPPEGGLTPEYLAERSRREQKAIRETLGLPPITSPTLDLPKENNLLVE